MPSFFKSLLSFIVRALGGGRNPAPPVAPPPPHVTPPPAETPPTIPAGPVTPADVAEARRAGLLASHNAIRASMNLPPLAQSTVLGAAAQAYASRLARDRLLSHEDGSTLETRLRQVNYPFTSAGENIAAGYTTPNAVMSGWVGSPLHFKNIVGPAFREVGFGFALSADGTPYWCADFGGRQQAGRLAAPAGMGSGRLVTPQQTSTYNVPPMIVGHALSRGRRH
jgi:uncharacterized protein YkwD